MTERIDWLSLAEPVVTLLLGEPNGRLTRGRRWRYGRKGSLSVDLDKGAWFDFEADRGGGLSKLIERELGVDWKGARRWLEQQGLIEPWKPDGRRRASGRRPPGPDRKQAHMGADAAPGPDSTGEPEDRRIALAGALWAAASGDVAGTPAMAYLSRRAAWPAPEGFGAGWPMVPEAFRWIDREAAAHVDRALLFGDPDRPFPGDASGALLAGYLDVPDYAGVRAVSLEALTAHGRRPAGGRWRKVRGVLKASCVVVPANPAGGCIAVVEGECDALAVALMARAGMGGLADVGEARCVAGTSGFQPDRAADEGARPVLLLPDGPGRDGKATAAGLAAKCAAGLRAACRTVRVRMRPGGDEAGDSAGDLAALVVERSARFEGPGVGPDEADRRAWRAILGLETEGE